jgi:hypothetical protein
MRAVLIVEGAHPERAILPHPSIRVHLQRHACGLMEHAQNAHILSIGMCLRRLINEQVIYQAGLQGRVISPRVTDLADMLCKLTVLQDLTDENGVGVTKDNEVTSRYSCQVLNSLQFKRASQQ